MDIGILVTGGPCESKYFPIEKFPCQIGRGKENAICLDKDPYVSSCHCQLDWDSKDYWLKDLNSMHGTYINGSRIEKPTKIFLKKNTVSIGKTHLLLVAKNQAAESENQEIALENMISRGSILIPASIFFQVKKSQESLFVVDICQSSRLAGQYGENALLKAIYVLGKILNRHCQINEVQFLKCTGDGFFATFRETKKALLTACHILQDVKMTVGKKEIHPFQIRIGIHHGPVSTDETGDRLGVACHLAFRLQEAKIEDRVYTPEGADKLPEEDRILLTDEALHSLNEDISRCFSYVGDFKFKGFDHPTRVNLLAQDIKIILGILK